METLVKKLRILMNNRLFLSAPHMSGNELKYIEKVFEEAVDGPIYVIKSTVLPGTTNALQSNYPHLKIIFSPEFLTERTAKLDMLTQSRIILGGELSLTEKAKTLFNQRFKIKNIIQTGSLSTSSNGIQKLPVSFPSTQ